MPIEKTLETYRKYKGLLIVLINGTVIMSLELTGSRLLAPYFGSSFYVWTGVIGVVLSFLSAGYWYGGKLADRHASYGILSKLLTLATATLLVTMYFAPYIIYWISGSGVSLIAGSFLATMYLFGPLNFILGMVSPFVAKLVLTDKKHSGELVGKVFAFGTIGSIIGTFVTGYVLFSFVGSTRIIFAGAISLAILSILANRRDWLWNKIALLVIGTALFVLYTPPELLGRQVIYDADTQYSKVTVYDTTFANQPARLLATDALSAQSGINLKTQESPFEYMKAFEETLKGRYINRALLIGGGTFTLDKTFHKNTQDTQLDIVEIDPALKELASSYFGFDDSNNTNIINADGRTFLNHNNTKYDIVFVDAFSSRTSPFQLTTTQAINGIRHALDDNGIVVVNIISRNNKDANLLQAIAATYRQQFQHVEAYRIQDRPSDVLQNNILIASNTPISLSDNSMFKNKIDINTDIKPLTDDFAPVELLTY